MTNLVISQPGPAVRHRDRILDAAGRQAAARDASAPDRLRAMLRARILVRFEAVAPAVPAVSM